MQSKWISKWNSGISSRIPSSTYLQNTQIIYITHHCPGKPFCSVDLCCEVYFVLYIEFAFLFPCLNPRFGHSSGTEAEVDPHAAAHAPWSQLGLQQQRALTAPGQLLPLHPHGRCHPAHLHPAGCLLPHRYSKAGMLFDRASPYCYIGRLDIAIGCSHMLTHGDYSLWRGPGIAA